MRISVILVILFNLPAQLHCGRPFLQAFLAMPSHISHLRMEIPHVVGFAYNDRALSVVKPA